MKKKIGLTHSWSAQQHKAHHNSTAYSTRTRVSKVHAANQWQTGITDILTIYQLYSFDTVSGMYLTLLCSKQSNYCHWMVHFLLPKIDKCFGPKLQLCSIYYILAISVGYSNTFWSATCKYTSVCLLIWSNIKPPNELVAQLNLQYPSPS